MKKNQGNVFTVLLGLAAVIGAVSYASYQMMSGPLSTMARANKKMTADRQMETIAKAVIVAAINGASNGDCDSDNSIEPSAWRTTTSNKPTGAGLVPSTLGVPLSDPWGSSYGYCVWDVGSAIKAGGCGGAGANRLSGSPTPLAGNPNTQTVLAVVSPGPDRQYQTTCRNYVDSTTDVILVTGDDLILRYTYTEASNATSSLWTLKSGTPGTATINKDLEIGDNSTTGAIAALRMSTVNRITAGGGLQLGNDTIVTACSGAVDGMIRYNATSTKLEYCDGTGWVEAGSGVGASEIDELLDAFADYTTGYNIFLGKDAGRSSVTTSLRNTGVGYRVMANMSAAAQIDNTAIGYLAMQSIDGSAQYNTAIGSQALSLNTGGIHNTAMGMRALQYAGASVRYNTAVGTDALTSLVLGDENVAVGYRTNAVAQAASFNVAIGSYAMETSLGTSSIAIGMQAMRGDADSIPVNNIAIGETAMYSLNSTASANIAIGKESLYNSTSGLNNIAIGFSALSSQDGIDNNTAFGHYALQNNATGQYNTAFGNFALVGNDSGEQNTAIGHAALRDNNATGNTAFGFKALSDNKTGEYNVAFGTYALHALQATNYNTAVGPYAMYGSNAAMGDAQDNVAVGYHALYNASSNARSIAIGMQALYKAAKADMVDNIAIGVRALYSAENAASPNIGIGYYALYNNQAGTNNVAIGYYALSDNTSGSYNIAIGDRVLVANADGYVNIGIGYNALSANVGGYYNIAIGNQALLINENGNLNTAIGSYALSNATSDSNIAIGKDALVSTVAGSSNIAIGSAASYNNIAGANNVMVGANAGFTSDSDGNTGLGLMALYKNTTGTSNTAAGVSAALNGSDAAYSGNTAIGYYALYTNSSGSNNTAVGAYAAHQLTSSENTALGFAALAGAVTSGANNAVGTQAMTAASGASVTGNNAFGYGALSGSLQAGANDAIGYAALSGTTTGTSNVGIGYRAGYNNTTGSGNVAVGNGAGPNAAGYSNTIALGSGASVTASNTAQVGNGSITVIAGQVAWTATSDRRIKKDIHPSDLGLDFVNALKPVSYRLKNGNGRLDYGFIAQDVEQALDGRVTNMVVRDHDGEKRYHLRIADLIAPLVKSIQELSAADAAHTESFASREKDFSLLEEAADYLLAALLASFAAGVVLGFTRRRTLS